MVSIEIRNQIDISKPFTARNVTLYDQAGFEVTDYKLVQEEMEVQSWMDIARLVITNWYMCDARSAEFETYHPDDPIGTKITYYISFTRSIVPILNMRLIYSEKLYD